MNKKIKVAFISDITGQDGSFLAELLLEKGIILEGSGVNEIGREKDTNKIFIRVDEKYFRPKKVDQLLGDASKARKKLEWEPSPSLRELIAETIHEDANEAKQEFILKSKGSHYMFL